MSGNDNPYGGNGYGDGYASQTVSFGGGEKAPAPRASGQLIKDATTASFQADVIAESRNQPVLVDFWAPWCGPCRQLGPVIEKVVTELGGAVKLVKMNIDDHPAIPGQLGIQSIPAVIAFRDGQPVDGFMGAIPESEIRAFISKLGTADPEADAIARALEQAAELAAAGNIQQAAQLYQAVMQRVPDNVVAIAGLAGIMLDNGQADEVREVIAGLTDEQKATPEIGGIVARLALLEKVAAIGDPAALEARLAANPKDHDARFDLAMVHNAAGNREAAANELLAIIRADRTWRDDGARKQLLELFDAWGPTDQATLDARRRLSSLLFS